MGVKKLHNIKFEFKISIATNSLLKCISENYASCQLGRLCGESFPHQRAILGHQLRILEFNSILT